MSARTLNYCIFAAWTIAFAMSLHLWFRGAPSTIGAVIENGSYFLETRSGALIETDATNFWLIKLRGFAFVTAIALTGVEVIRDDFRLDQSVGERKFPSLREKAKKGAASLLTNARGGR